MINLIFSCFKVISVISAKVNLSRFGKARNSLYLMGLKLKIAENNLRPFSEGIWNPERYKSDMWNPLLVFEQSSKLKCSMLTSDFTRNGKNRGPYFFLWSKLFPWIIFFPGKKSENCLLQGPRFLMSPLKIYDPKNRIEGTCFMRSARFSDENL